MYVLSDSINGNLNAAPISRFRVLATERSVTLPNFPHAATLLMRTTAMTSAVVNALILYMYVHIYFIARVAQLSCICNCMVASRRCQNCDIFPARVQKFLHMMRALIFGLCVVVLCTTICASLEDPRRQTYDISCPKDARELRFGLDELERALTDAGSHHV